MLHFTFPLTAIRNPPGGAITLRCLLFTLAVFSIALLAACEEDPTQVLLLPPPSLQTAATDTSCQCGDTVNHNLTFTADILDCPGDGLIITYSGSDSLVLDGAGHRLTGSKAAGSAGLRLTAGSKVKIKNFIITDFESGIRMSGGTNNVIAMNELADNTYGLWATGSSKNQVIINSIHDNYASGIEFGFVSTGNLIEGNDLSKNGVGLYVYARSGYGTVLWNTIQDCRTGMRFYSGSGYNIVEDNSVSNSRSGIVLESSTTEYNVLRRNTLERNSIGIELVSSGNNTIANNTVLDSGVGIQLGKGPECSQNSIRDNIIQKSSTGVALHFATDNLVIGNTIVDTRGYALSMTSCDNDIQDNLGNQGLPIVYINGSATIRNTTLAQLVVCGSNDLSIKSVTILGHGGNGILLRDSHSVVMSEVRFEGCGTAARLANCSDVWIEACTFFRNSHGLSFNGTDESVVTGNYFTGGLYNAITLESGRGNRIWNNQFEGDSPYLAFETEGSSGNAWSVAGIGNYWEDFSSNAGYPDRYIVPGLGDGIDHYPLNDMDSDGFKAWEDCGDDDPMIHLGSIERCNGRDDDCDGMIDESACPPAEDVR